MSPLVLLVFRNGHCCKSEVTLAVTIVMSHHCLYCHCTHSSLLFLLCPRPLAATRQQLPQLRDVADVSIGYPHR